MTEHRALRRARARYASDALAERAASLALKLGVKLKLSADGSVEITGKLDTQASDALALGQEGGADADDYEAWKREHFAAGR